jgi:hypothetical protein
MQEGPGGQLRSLTTPYTCLYQPLTAPDAEPALLRRAAEAFGRHARACPLLLFEALDPAWPGLAPFRQGLGDAGFVTRTFAHFGNWYEEVRGGWTAYLETRPGALRTTIRRKTRAAERDPTLRLEQPAALGPALDAYEDVYRRSWKTAEPYPDFNRALVARLGSAGVLRFGLMWAKERPIAAQYWMVSPAGATVLKLAHDDADRAVSPGTVLTAFMIRRLIEDGTAVIDFGRGDDPYKRGWVSERRERIGLVGYNPRSRQGLGALARHEGGRVLRLAKNLFRERRNWADNRPA